MKKLMPAILVALILVVSISTRAYGDPDPQATCSTDGGPLDAPTNPNKKNTTDGGSDPINMATGAFTFTRTDLTLPGPMPITFTRTYTTAVNGYGNYMGQNWDDNCHRKLYFGSAAFGYCRGDGVCVQLFPDAYDSSGHHPTHAVTKQQPYFTLTTDDEVHFVISDKFGNKDYFTTQNIAYANVTKSVDRNGNELDYTYPVYSTGYWGPLATISDPKSNRSLSFSYNDRNNITSITDSAGRTVTYDYSNETNGGFYRFLSQVTYPSTAEYPDGITEKYGYEDEHNGVENITTITDGKNHVVVTNEYGALTSRGVERVVKQTYNGVIGNLSYDDENKIVSFTNYNGNTTDYYSDGNGNIIKKVVHAPATPLHSNETASMTFTTIYEYGNSSPLAPADAGGGGGSPSGGGVHLSGEGPAHAASIPNNCYKTKEIDPNGNGTMWTYDDLGNVLTVTKFAPPGTTIDTAKGTQVLTAQVIYTYESRFNQIATVTDANGKVTTYDYGTASSNPKGNLISITSPTTAAGTAVESFTYNTRGQVLTDTTNDGVTQNNYDDVEGGATYGYLMQKIQDYGSGKLNATTNYTYDGYGHVASIQDPNGHTTTIATNAMGQVTEIDGPSGEVEQRSYDRNWNVTVDKNQISSGQWQTTEKIYNDAQQVSEIRSFTGGGAYLSTTFGYDANGNRTTVTDPLGHVTTTYYDGRDKPYKVKDTLNHTVTSDFDGNGNTVSMKDERGHITSYTYDGFDQLEEKAFPDGSYQTWIYDKAGNVTSLRTTAGNTIVQTFDNRNRILTQVYGSSTITNTYDVMGRLHTATEGGVGLDYEYDALGRNTSFSDQAGRTSTYCYDSNGGRLTSAYPTGITVKQVYDSSSRLWKLKDGSDSIMATFSYDSAGRVTGTVLANSTSVSYGQDLLSRLTSVHNSLGSGNRNYGYVYDDASRRTSETKPRGTVGYGYSARNELTSITEPDGSPFADQGFEYDATFNRTSWTLGSTTTNYTANNLNQYTVISGTTAPTWNTDGGLSAYAGNTYFYDALQRLTEVDSTSNKCYFSYDPLGRRIKKVVKDSTSTTTLATYEYHYDGSAVAVEYQPSTTWTYFGGLMRTDGTNKQWYYRDGLGSISAVADNSGNLLEAYDYNAQGQFQITSPGGTVLSATGIANDLLFAGYRFDAETKNYFCNARYYNPVLGRFISRDPLSGAEFSQGTNLYAYCRNGYPNSIDPTGMCFLDGKLTAGGYYGPDELTKDLLTGDRNYDGPVSWGEIFDDIAEAQVLMAPLFLDEGIGLGRVAEEAEAGGTGFLHYYELETGPHFSVEIAGQETEQVILEGGGTTMEAVEGLTPTASVEFLLSDVGAAQELQLARLGADLGDYNRLSNSCLTNARDILNAGGASLPTSNLRLGIWAKTTFGF